MFLLRDTSINSKEKVESNKMKKKKKKNTRKYQPKETIVAVYYFQTKQILEYKIALL